MKENDPKKATDSKAAEKKNNRKKQMLLLAAIIVLMMAAGLVIWIVLRGTDRQQDTREEKIDLSELHVFPPIDFVDSLYHKKTLVSYEDESPRDVYYYEKDKDGQPTDRKVHETHYYPGKKKYIDGNLNANGRDGLWYAYHANGQVQTMGHYVNGVEHGRYAVYYENGSVRYTGMYDHGKRVGKWMFFDEQEKLIKTEDFDKKNAESDK